MSESFDVDLILFFKYLDGLNGEKSVKALSFKLEKHPSTIRRMIKKVEDFFNVGLVIYENYQCIITNQGKKFLDKYYELGEDISLKDLWSSIDNNITNPVSLIINKEFFIPYILNFIEKNPLDWKDILIDGHWDKGVGDNTHWILFSDQIEGDNYYHLHLYIFKHKTNPREEVLIHENIYHNLKKILDLSIFNKIIVVNNLSIMHFYIEKNYSFIGYQGFTANQDQWTIKSLNFSINLWSNYNSYLIKTTK